MLIKRYIEIYYKVIFNHVLKKQGLTINPSLAGSCLISISALMFTISLVNIYCITMKIDCNFHSNVKENYSFTFILFFLMYLLLFSVFKFKRTGEGVDKSFMITTYEKKIVWIFYYSNFINMPFADFIAEVLFSFIRITLLLTKVKYCLGSSLSLGYKSLRKEEA